MSDSYLLVKRFVAEQLSIGKSPSRFNAKKQAFRLATTLGLSYLNLSKGEEERAIALHSRSIVINGSDTNFSHPFVLTYPKNGFPTDRSCWSRT